MCKLASVEIKSDLPSGKQLQLNTKLTLMAVKFLKTALLSE
jgi:hypothetical protein